MEFFVETLAGLHGPKYHVMSQRKKTFVVQQFIVEHHVALVVQHPLIVIGKAKEFIGFSILQQMTEFIEHFLVFSCQLVDCNIRTTNHGRQ